MATVDKRLCSGTLTGSRATLYTAPSGVGAITIIKAITICNKSAAAAKVTLLFDGIEVISNYTLGGAMTITIPFMDHIIEASEVIEGFSNTAAVVNYYISGKEVS